MYDSGTVCLSITNPEGWKPSINIKQILLGIQELLNDPNLDSPANGEAARTLRRSPAEYERLIREQTKAFTEN